MRFLPLFLLVFVSACSGYRWQDKSNPWAEKGYHKVYVSIMLNNSLRSGAEVPFTSAFVRAFSRGNKLRVVSDEGDADILVNANLDNIASEIISSTRVVDITKDASAEALSDVMVATDYIAKASVTVRFVTKKTNETLIEQKFERSKIYQGNNRFGKLGTTSALINDSQFQVALNEVARSIAADAYDTMLESF